ncbi:MMPL family transporter [Lactobacillus mulieris]|uniref:MMPL family transporter n=1 Tax=Lactobacillus mulieris TaxID=2508708 RepID=A0AAW5WXH3_9LACO|nr:MMPL family transporter [Lactobacillus mulieris]MCZ3621744.1 MMPL family transporter [Lactobacillus mulieris]MCZ3623441.1 MMPL family transporter [Lactobacillus mulieris]MCZ3635751.1 MMPL family transporter [Lactobacillus mulieris]MCZ3690533.1 MMPL family transporter [Lactobacillus mulieris]MCZ3696459.1 MMPL family transporter [Lactobacillus mulieris]
MQKFIKNHVFSLIAWLLILVISIVALPNVNQLTRDHAEIKLPADTQTTIAQTFNNEWSNKTKNTYEIALVFNKKDGKLTKSNQAAIDQTISDLKENKEKYGIKNILAPNDNTATKKRLKSKDKTTWLVQLNVSKSHGTISDINKELQKAVKTKGVATYVTGADILNDDFSASIQEGIKKTELISIIFIFIVLVLVFRSPIVPLISLFTVGVSFLTAFSIVTNLVKSANFPFSNFTQVFMVIVLFGIGTDYNILLYDKFKENLGNGLTVGEATKDALHKAGRTILFSGSSILIGFSALALAKFSIYQSATGVAVGVAVLLLVLLTLNPFFMMSLGAKMFWPVKKFEGESESKVWTFLASNSVKRPILHIIVTFLIVTPFMALYSGHLNYDDTDEISNDTPSKAGLLVVQKHFSKGMAMPSYLYIKSNHTLDNEADLKLIDEATRQLQASKGVSLVTSVTQPYGEKVSQLYVNKQLNTVTQGVGTAQSGLTKLSNGSSQMTNGLGQLVSGSQTLTNGLNTMTSQLNSQMSTANQSQLAQLQTALPQINQGIQELNSALRSSGASIDTTSLTNNLTDAGNNAKLIGNNLTAAGEILKQLQASTSTSSADTSQILAQYRTVEDKAGLNDQQKQAMEQALMTILSGVNNKVQAQTSAATTSLEKVAANLQAAGLADQSLGNNLSNVATTLQGLSGLSSQISTLQTEVNKLATASNLALPGANQAITKLSSGLNQVQSAVSTASNGSSQITSGAQQLYNNSPALTDGINKVNSGLGEGATYLSGLADSAASDEFYIPKKYLKSSLFQKSINNYMSNDKKMTKIIVVLDSNPSSDKAAVKSHKLSAMVKKSLAGTDLKDAEVVMGGQSSRIQDTRQTASKDFTRTAIIMLVGIGLALIVVTRSVLQPLFILGTLLIAYFSSLTINEWFIKAFMGKDMLTWNTPFFSFIMIIALGVDYSIFLMMRYRELDEATASERMVHASAIIGTVVISAAIILGGTFAALIPSGIPTLIEVAITVIVGLAILVILMPILLSAAVKLTYEGFKKSKH